MISINGKRLNGLLTLSQAARELGLSPSTLTRWGSRGLKKRDGSVVKLALVRIGKKARIDREELDQFLAQLNSPDGAAPPIPTETRRVSEALDRAGI